MTKHLRNFLSIAVTFTVLPLPKGALGYAKVGRWHRSFTVSVVGTGKPIILIPGFECSGQVWAGVIDHFKTTYEIHTLTLAGFAGVAVAPLPDTYTSRLAMVRDDLIEYIREKKLSRPVIVGHSMGGFLAFWVAATVPELPDSIISVDGVPFFPALFNPKVTTAETVEQGKRYRIMMSSMKAEQMGAMSRLSLSHMITDAKNIERAAEWGKDSDPATTGRFMYELMTIDLRSQVFKIQAPVLLMEAAKAFAEDAEMLRRISAQYEAQVEKAPHHKLVMALHSLHFVMFDDLPFLLQTINDFLKLQRVHDAH